MTIFVCRRKGSLWFVPDYPDSAPDTYLRPKAQSFLRNRGAYGLFLHRKPVREQLPGAGGLGGGASQLTAAVPFPSLSGLCVGPSCSVCCFSECNRQGVLADRAVNCSFYLGCPGRRTPGKKDSASAMGQLCCFPLAREEEKISKCDSYCAESRV